MTVEKLRVTILGLHYAPEPTGNAPYTASLAEGLSTRGYSVRVITSHPHYPEWKIREGYGGWLRREVIGQTPITRLRHYVPGHPGTLHRLLSELSFGLRLIGTHWGKPDIVILVSPALFSTALASLKARLGLHRPATLVWAQDLYSLGIIETGQGGGVSAKLMELVESATFKSAHGVAVIHERFRSHVTAGLKVPTGRVEVVRNWSHLPSAPMIDRGAVRLKHGWLPDEYVVLHAGNMGAKQALENVVAAARLADAQFLPLRYVLLGDGNQRSRVEKLGSGIKRLQFMDPLNDTDYQNALASADVLLVNEKPGVSEMSVPSKLTSYFSTGLPVIAATDLGSVTAGEIEYSGGGVRVNAGDPQALNESVMKLIALPELRATLGQNGLKFRQTHLSQDAAIDHFSRWISRVQSIQCARKATISRFSYRRAR